MAQKLIDASDPTAPLPAWHWLIWWTPDYRNLMPDERAEEYLLGGTDDEDEVADYRARGFSVRENPVWRTLN